MANTIDVLMYCKKGKQKLAITFEEKQPGEWHGVDLQLIRPVSFFDRVKAEMKGGGGGGKRTISEDITINGSIYYDLTCPNCGSNGFVKCGACGKLTCHVYGEKSFKCASCGNEGTITGTVDSLDGNRSRNNNGDSIRDGGKRMPEDDPRAMDPGNRDRNDKGPRLR